MPSLVAKSPCDGLLPVEIGDVQLSEVSPDTITLVSPFDSKSGEASDALKAEYGVGFPAPNRTTGKAGIRVIWCGPGQAFVLGPKVSVSGAAMVDQSDGWACIAIEGARAKDILARLTPLDLRDGVFKRSHTARTQLNHMTISLTRTGANRYEILVFRSMAKTAVRELTEAMERVAARG